ncbi:diguanylate cyclase with PAS/PAC sensor [Ferrimonas balearica DSM 9799]|uniref:diguanylate cyclase n=1 Tax=Ferrimonas balearica (strain DSM 9799 / CCM 4581 / KCTC 23876 / PAT) TaxID=550540 RepID=E1SWL2_FERBD|nr:diguanylate cyclase [Ferrimonas balearica]ADN77474.1 diguanylate cyclase with PAS/PAC sensor [Ferrimonas balearica DSM 9799]MBW3139535.1 diguanylate cyclase [Ferrimonas balearica]MBY5980578.1 diguanylate cyclase [Ferrimonas balearica]MBY6094310.1 diguanylate cyclase [Ferrimonas balearica]MBY6107343.1 diguanylate cyclase [Ferrimonas balearica]
MNEHEIEHLHRLTQLLQGIEVGLVVINRDYQVQLWNGFMENHSGLSAKQVRDQSLFDLFPDLPKEWLISKLEAAFLLNSRSFTVWEQRPFVFPFRYSRPITGGNQMMCQNMTVQPLQDLRGEVSHAALILYDVSVQAADRRQLTDANEKLERLSQIDPLTGLANRRQWEQALEQEFQRCRRYQPPSCLLVVDVDHFKQVNDQHGHAVGDQVLNELGNLLARSLRKTDLVARYGGEEFVILLTETRPEQGRILAERLREAVEEMVMKVPQSLNITVSLGLCPYQHSLASAQAWFEEADRALYQAKQNGRNRVEVA